MAVILLLCCFAAVFAVAAIKTDLARARKVFLWARRLFIFAAGLAVLALVLLTAAFLADDFSVAAAAQYSSMDLPFFYKLSAVWAGSAGSLLLWSVGVFLVFVFWLFRSGMEDPAFETTALSIGAGVCAGFSALLVFVARPFAGTGVLIDEGMGLNPLLQNFWMVIHPPLLFIGYSAFLVPFVIAVSCVFAGRMDDTAIYRQLRWWLLFGVCFLGLGIATGARWSYVELGWGGYWAWDPVETSSLVPWIALTAFMHAQVGFQRDGQYKHLLPILGGLTVVFILLATFVTRSGVWSSLHAYAGASSAGVGERIRAALAGSSSLRVLYYTMWSVLVATLAIPVARLMRAKEEEPLLPSRMKGATTREYVSGGRFTSWATMIATVVALSFMMLLVVTVLARSVSSSVSPSDYHRFVLPLVVLAALVMMVCLLMRSLGLRRAVLAAAATLVAAALVAVADPGGAGAVPWLMGVVGLAAVVTVATSGTARTWKLRRSPGPAVARAGSTLLHMGIAMIILAYGFSNVSDNPQESVDLQVVSDTASLAGYKVSITDRSWHPDTGFLARGEYWDSFQGTLMVDRGGTTVQREAVDVTLRWQYRAYGTFTSNGTGAPVSIDGEVMASSFDGGHYLVRVENATNPEQSAVFDLSDRVHTSVSPWPAVERQAGFLVGQYVKVSNSTRTWSGFLVGIAPAVGPVTLSTSSGQVVLPRSEVSTFSRRAYIGVVISDVHIHRNAAEDLYVTVTDAHPVAGGGFAASVLVKRIPGMAILWWGMYLAAAGVFLRFLSGAVRGRRPAKVGAEGDAPVEEGAERPPVKEDEASFDEWWERKLGEGEDE